jgi:hypothetical protein
MVNMSTYIKLLRTSAAALADGHKLRRQNEAITGHAEREGWDCIGAITLEGVPRYRAVETVLDGLCDRRPDFVLLTNHTLRSLSGREVVAVLEALRERGIRLEFAEDSAD